jgi:hypothetical protein
MAGTSLNTGLFFHKVAYSKWHKLKDTSDKQYKDVFLNVKPKKYLVEPMFRLQDMDCHLNMMKIHKIYQIVIQDAENLEI